MVTRTTLKLAVTCILLSIIACEVRFAFTIISDAAKSPDQLNPSNQDLAGEYWTNTGDLTGSGMRQHFLLGMNNYNRWSTFLSASYNSNELYVKSVPDKSAVSSLISHLQGLYSSSTGPTLTTNQQTKAVPPITSSLFAAEQITLGTSALPNLDQVIPIDLFNSNDRYYFFKYNFDQCPSLMAIVQNNSQLTINVNAVQNFETNWGTKLTTAVQIPNSQWLLNFDNVNRICDEFVSDYVDDRVTASYTTAGIDLSLFYSNAQNFQYLNNFYYHNGDPNMMFAKVSATSIFEDITGLMASRMLKDQIGTAFDNADPKLVIYSANDLTLGSMQTVLAAAFNIGSYFATPYASSFILELTVPDNSNLSLLVDTDYMVTITYNEVTYLAATPFPQFIATLQNYLLTTQQIDDFCGWSSLPNDSSNAYINATIVLSCLLFLALIVIIVFAIRHAKQSRLKIAFRSENPVATI